MAGKRGASSDLNHDNWNHEDEPEDKGIFKRASDDTLKTRVIKTAKRRNFIRTEEDGDKKSAFVGFTGFGPRPPSSDFSFLKDLSKTDGTSKTNGACELAESKSTNDSNIFNISKTNTSIFGAPVSASSTNIFGASSNLVPSLSTKATGKTDNYCSRLKGLNESVSKWIGKKVEENPFISLQPIFKDYEKYLDEIEKAENQIVDEGKEVSKTVPTFNFNPAADKNTKAIPDSTSEKTNETTNKEAAIPTFKLGASTSTSAKTEVLSAAPTFTFGSANNASSGTTASLTSTSTISGGFSFGSNASGSTGGFSFPTSTNGFSFGGVKQPEPEAPKEVNENDEDEPPKVEFKPVVEKDHLYTIRCKVFVKSGERFGDRGVGNLYLKPIENSDKVQLIVRADTNLGNLLLNMILSESIPIKRVGKKDVMMVAVSTPDAKPPPTPVLVRVKSPEEADALLEVLEKHKK